MLNLDPSSLFVKDLAADDARPLCIQFVLQYMLKTFELLNKTKAMIKNQSGHRIKEEMEKLFVFAIERSATNKQTLFDKLCFYCHILIYRNNLKNREFGKDTQSIAMIALLEDVKHKLIDFTSQLTIYLNNRNSPANLRLVPCLKEYLHLLNEIYQKICDLFNALIPFLKEAIDDENIFVYLIEKKEAFNFHLGVRKLEDTFQSIFPEGPKQLRTLIVENYTKRGFSAFASQIAPLIDAMEWDAPCLAAR